MKKIIAYIPMHICFWVGHWVSIPMYKYDLSSLYFTYNSLMGWSHDLSEWAQLDFWVEDND